MPTWHVHHPAVAAPQHGLLLAAQPAGRHTVSRVALKLRLLEPILCPAVAPGLGQVGQLQRWWTVSCPGTLPSPLTSPLCPTLGSDPLLLAGHKGLEAWGHAKAQLVDVGGLILAMNLHSDTSLKRCFICKAEM